jgi:hypothetical protein
VGRGLGPWAGPARPEIQTGRAGPKFKQYGPFRAWAGPGRTTRMYTYSREPREQRGGSVAQRGAGVEGEAVARGGVDLHPARAGEGAGVAVGGRERHKDEREDLVGHILGVVLGGRRKRGGTATVAVLRSDLHRRGQPQWRTHR